MVRFKSVVPSKLTLMRLILGIVLLLMDKKLRSMERTFGGLCLVIRKKLYKLLLKKSLT
jgi:hypothetical protein